MPAMVLPSIVMSLWKKGVCSIWSRLLWRQSWMDQTPLTWLTEARRQWGGQADFFCIFVILDLWTNEKQNGREPSFEIEKCSALQWYRRKVDFFCSVCDQRQSRVDQTPLIRLRDERRGRRRAGVFDSMLHASHSSQRSRLQLCLSSSQQEAATLPREALYQRHAVAAVYQSPIPSKLYLTWSPPPLFSQSSYNITPPTQLCANVYTTRKESQSNLAFQFQFQGKKWAYSRM